MRTIPGNDHRNFNEPSTWIALFDVSLGPGDVQYLTPCPSDMTVDGNEYRSYPMLLEELREDGKGEVATVKLTVSNVEGLLGTKLRQANCAVDGQPIVFKVWSVEQGAVVYQDNLEIVKVGPITVKTITFELGMFNPFTVKLLQEKFLRDFCWNTYKGRGCWVLQSDGTFIAPSAFDAGDPDSCTRRMADCIRHGNVLRLNSFPGLPGTGSYV